MSKSEYDKVMKDTLQRVLHPITVLRGQDYRIHRIYEDLPRNVLGHCTGSILGNGASIEIDALLTLPIPIL